MWQTIKKWLKRGLILIVAYAFLFFGVFAWQMISAQFGDPDADLVDDTKAGKLDRQTDNAAIIESVRKMVTIYRTPEYQRDAHAKAHGCVRAHFEVFDTESKYNHGLFAHPGKYESWVRFSSGSVPVLNDTKGDARGMAIKVMDVPGEQLLPPLLAGKTQDFVMINSPAFFIRTISGYRELERLTAQQRPFTYFFGEHYINPFKWNLRELYLGLSTRKKGPATPLSTQYFSMSPYQLGPHQMKYSAKSCEDYQALGINEKDPNFMREAMKKVLRNEDACFQFMVQLRDPQKRMPIQDTTVVWSEKDAPFVPVGRVHIPRQEFDTPEQNRLCEDMNFNVWHGVKDLKPLSYINELRRDLYLHTAAYRNVRNGVVMKEPTSWANSFDPYKKAPESNESAPEAADEQAPAEASEADEAAPDPLAEPVTAEADVPAVEN